MNQQHNQKYHLHHLIKSMSISEKGYFKKYYAKYGGSQSYLDFFDAVDDMEDYDEEKIREIFVKEGFVNQLSVAKNYLIKNILKSLRAYHSESSKYMELNELMIDIEIMYQKRLSGICDKLIKKARKLMESAELFNKYSELASWEIRLANLEGYSKDKEKKVKEIYDFALDGIEKDKNLTAYRHLAYHLFNLSLKEGATRQEENIKFASEFLRNPLLSSENNALSITAKGIYHNIMSKIYEIQYDYQHCYLSSKKFADIIHENPSIFENNVTNYVLPAHYNLLLTCIYLNKKEPFFENLRRMEQIPERYPAGVNPMLDKIIKLMAANAEIQYYVQNGYFQEAVNLVPKAEKVVDDDNSIGFLSLKVEIYYNIAYAYFGMGNYSTCIDWLNRFIQKEQLDLREDLLAYAWLLSLTSHYELKNFRYLGYKLKTTFNFISKMQKVHKFEGTTLDFIKKLIKSKSEEQSTELMKTYKTIFEEMEKDPYERVALKSFDITSWIDSHLSGKSFAEIAKLKNQLLKTP
jgi:tetratricopeptide (TPR) repeat protein